jgi:predicted RND superfamily exporter protein
MSKIGAFIIHHSKIIIITVLVITAALAVIIGVRGIGFNGSIETLAMKGDDLDFYKETRRMFGDDRVIIIALTTSDVFAKNFIEKLDRLTARLATIDGVAEVQSLTNIKAARRTSEGIVIEKLLPRHASQDQLRAIKDVVVHDPLYAKLYVSRDGRTTAINVFLAPVDEARVRAVTSEVERVAKSEAAGDELLLAGAPIMDAQGISLMVRDLVVCSPVAAIVCLAAFLLAFRQLWIASLPMVMLVIGLTWTMGLMSLLGQQITIAVLTLPTVLMAVGSSYMFHLLNQHQLSIQERTSWIDGLEFIVPAVAVSGMTAAAGFGALASSAIPTVRDMGLFESVGVLIMLVLTLSFVPASLWSLSSRIAASPSYSGLLKNSLRNITALVLFRSRAICIVTLALTLFMSAGLMRLRINADYLHIFPPSSGVVHSAEKLHERLAGAAVMELVVSGPPGSIYEPEFFEWVAALEEFALNQPGVDAAISVADIIKRFNGLLTAAGEGLPTNRTQIERIFQDFLSGQQQLARLVNADRTGSRAVIVLRTNLFSSSELRRLTDQLNQWSRANLPEWLSARATGAAILLNNASDAIATSQLKSLVIALIVIYLMTVVMFRSFRIGLLVMVANSIPILWYFGLLGWAGISLDITTSLIATAALGLAVDNAIHFIRRYQWCSVEARDQGWAMWLTMLRSGKPVLLANAMLMAAFLVFMLSSFAPIRLGGLLWAATIFACLMTNLIFLPVLVTVRLRGANEKHGSFCGSIKRAGELKAALLVCLSLTLFGAYSCKSSRRSGSQAPAIAQRSDSTLEAKQIIEKYRALSNYRDLTMRLQARIKESDETSRVVRLTIYRKRSPNGGEVMLVEFTSPPGERDRDGLIQISPDGEIEATRYMQGTGSFIIARSASSEDSLFGLSLQEIVDGQPEKYTYKLIGETYVGQMPAYRIEGRLKQGADSKFPRVVMSIAKENFVALSVEFYESPNELARRVMVDRVQQIGGYWTRMQWSVDNLARGKKIEFEVIDVKYDQSLPDSIFTRQRLKQVASEQGAQMSANGDFGIFCAPPLGVVWRLEWS